MFSMCTFVNYLEWWKLKEQPKSGFQDEKLDKSVCESFPDELSKSELHSTNSKLFSQLETVQLSTIRQWRKTKHGLLDMYDADTPRRNVSKWETSTNNKIVVQLENYTNDY